MVFPSSRPTFKKDSRHLRVAAFFGFIICRGSFVVEAARCRASGFECIGPLGGRDGFAFGEPLRRRCPWTDNNVILRRFLTFAGCGQSMKYVVIGLSDPDAVGAGPGHALPGLRVYTFKTICPRQMVSFGVRRKSGWPLFVPRSPCNPLELCYNETTKGAVW